MFHKINENQYPVSFLIIDIAHFLLTDTSINPLNNNKFCPRMHSITAINYVIGNVCR